MTPAAIPESGKAGPMTNTTPFRPTIRTQADLQRTWQRLMSPLGFSGHSIWMLVIGPDDRPLPQITELTEAELPDDLTPEDFARLLRHLRDAGIDPVRFAFLRSRPGPGGVTVDDRTWATFLYDAARLANVPVDVVHRACDQDVVPIPFDEVLDEPA
jgi:hypothetical protein